MTREDVEKHRSRNVLREIIEQEYNMLCSWFGVNSRCWDVIHLNYSQYAFCFENQKSLIAEYLIWEEFVEQAQKEGFIYYYGIDVFLEKYKLPVYKSLNLE